MIIISCTVCGARPWPSEPGVRETFSLRRYGPDGIPAETPAPGEWFCERHIPEQKSVPKPRSVRTSAKDVVIDLERVLEGEDAHIDDAIAERDNISETLRASRKEIARSLTALKQAVGA
jgi:hypothetical protein